MEKVQIIEVGPRDGLQNECQILSVKDKLWFVQSLVQAGIRDVELGAFVRPDRVPQMADTDHLYKAIQKKKLKLGSVRAWSLVPNRKGLERALNVGVTHIAIFTAATETFAEKNIGMSIRESLVEFRKVIQEARDQLGQRKKRLFVRGYISTAFGCPFEGRVSAKKAFRVIEKLAALGVDQISIGDTIGIATPADVEKLVKLAIENLGQEKLALHFHDTRGTALANALRAFELGVRSFDSSAGGLGGCPFAPGASGNLATEDLVYMLDGMGVHTGVHLDRLCKISLKLASKMKKPLTSRYLQAYAAQRRL